MRATVKKFYKVENSGYDHPENVRFISLTKKKATRVGREDLLNIGLLELEEYVNYREVYEKVSKVGLYDEAFKEKPVAFWRNNGSES